MIFCLKKEAECKRISIAPKPAGAFIEIGGAAETALYEIIKPSGQLAQSGRLSAAAVDISKLAMGLYYLRIDGQHVAFIKE